MFIYLLIYSSLYSFIYSLIYFSFYSSIYSLIYSSFYSSIYLLIYSSFYSSIYSLIYSSFYSSIYSSLYSLSNTLIECIKHVKQCFKQCFLFTHLSTRSFTLHSTHLSTRSSTLHSTHLFTCSFTFHSTHLFTRSFTLLPTCHFTCSAIYSIIFASNSIELTLESSKISSSFFLHSFYFLEQQQSKYQHIQLSTQLSTRSFTSQSTCFKMLRAYQDWTRLKL